MWLEKSVMFPTLHSTIREVLDSTEATKVQFILEPLAFPELASLAKVHGQRFVEQVSYLTRTFAFYIHREYQSIIKLVNDGNTVCPAISNSMNSNCTNASVFSAHPDSTDVPYQQPLVPEVVPASGPDGQCLAVLCQYSSSTSQCSTTQSVPSIGVRTCPECARLPTPSSTPASSVSAYSVQTCTASLQGGDSAKAVQLLSKCQLSVCTGQGSVSDFIVEEGHHLLES